MKGVDEGHTHGCRGWFRCCGYMCGHGLGVGELMIMMMIDLGGFRMVKVAYHDILLCA